MVRPDAAHVENLFAYVLDKIPRLRQLHAELRTLERETRVDGYPTNSGLGELNGSSDAHADPTYLAVETRMTARDAPGHALNQFLKAVVALAKQCEIAESQAMQAFPPVEAPQEKDEMWCKSCLRANIFAPAAKARLCWFCYRWTREHNAVMPPAALIVLRDQGKTITNKVVRQLQAEGVHIGE